MSDSTRSDGDDSAFPFAPTRATLEAVLDYDDECGRATVSAGERRAAFARWERLSAGRDPRRTARAFAGLRWTSGRRVLATTPVPPVPAGDPEVDRPALAVENAGGCVHVGSVLLHGPPGPHADRRIVVSSLAQARRTHPTDLARATEAVVERRGDRFAALATAFANCGAFVSVPAGVALDAPIQLVWTYPEPQSDAVFPLVVVVLGAGARATILERHVGEGEPYVSALVRASVADDARLDYVVVQRLGDGARMHATRTARVAARARANFFVAELGGMHVRSVADLRLEAECAAGETAALFFAAGRRVVDLATFVDHRAPFTRSRTQVRAAAVDSGRGRFVGGIRMRPGAHESDGFLRDDALLLSRRARIETTPELVIRADDVRAFHAATVGSLDADALFYVQSRGIARADAARLITLAFFEPAVTRFPSESLRDEVRTALDGKIDDATELDA